MLLNHQTNASQFVYYGGKVNLAVSCSALQLYLYQLQYFPFDFFFLENVSARHFDISCEANLITTLPFYLFIITLFTAPVGLPQSYKVTIPVLFTPP